MDWAGGKEHLAKFSSLRIVGKFRDHQNIFRRVTAGAGSSKTPHPFSRFHINITDIALLDIFILQLRDVDLCRLHPVDELEPVLLWRVLKLNPSQRRNEKKCEPNGSKSGQASFVPILQMLR